MMVTVDIDHPDIEAYINWKVVEEEKVRGPRRLAPSSPTSI